MDDACRASRSTSPLLYPLAMTLTTTDPAVVLDDLRVRFRSFGLEERAAGTSFFYALAGMDGRMLLVLQPFGHGAQIYLYPEALERPAGAAHWFYAALEAEGFGMGSKLGPSISLDLTNPDRMRTFWSAFGDLLAGRPPGGEVRS